MRRMAQLESCHACAMDHFCALRCEFPNPAHFNRLKIIFCYHRLYSHSFLPISSSHLQSMLPGLASQKSSASLLVL